MKKLILILFISLIAVLLFGCTPMQQSLTDVQQVPDIDRYPATCIADACGDGECGNIEFRTGLCPKDCDNQITTNEGSKGGRRCPDLN